MSKYEILHSRLGDLLEMLECNAIANGADEKKDAMTFEQAMRMR